MMVSRCVRQHRHSGGFSLLELVFALLVVAVLVQIALPVFQDEVDRAKLAELEMRIDAMRTALKSAYAEGDYSMYHVHSPAPGVMPSEYAGLSIEDSLQYPGLSLMMASARSQYGVFDDGQVRPFLMIRAGDTEGAVTLRNFAASFPESRWGWLHPSTIMMVPLLDDPMPGSRTGSGATSGGSSSGGGTSGGSSSGGGTSGGGTSGGGTSGGGTSGGGTSGGGTSGGGTSGGGT